MVSPASRVRVFIKVVPETNQCGGGDLTSCFLPRMSVYAALLLSIEFQNAVPRVGE